jgi:hypothetical protein
LQHNRIGVIVISSEAQVSDTDLTSEPLSSPSLARWAFQNGSHASCMGAVFVCASGLSTVLSTSFIVPCGQLINFALYRLTARSSVAKSKAKVSKRRLAETRTGVPKPELTIIVIVGSQFTRFGNVTIMMGIETEVQVRVRQLFFEELQNQRRNG